MHGYEQQMVSIFIHIEDKTKTALSYCWASELSQSGCGYGYIYGTSEGDGDGSGYDSVFMREDDKGCSEICNSDTGDGFSFLE
jgi:hypothetical protein